MLHGGTITAKAGEYSVGIGSALCGECINIVIDGGMITATGRQWSAAIGAGDQADCGTITIGGKVTGNISANFYTYQP